MSNNEYLGELYEKAYKNNKTGGCTTRAQLLFLALEKSGLFPKILRYFIKGEKFKDEKDRKKLKLLDNSEFPSHVVVELNDDILDPNIGRSMSKKEYDSKLSEKSKHDVEATFYPGIDYGLCKSYVERYELDKFRFLFN